MNLAIEMISEEDRWRQKKGFLNRVHRAAPGKDVSQGRVRRFLAFKQQQKKVHREHLTVYCFTIFIGIIILFSRTKIQPKKEAIHDINSNREADRCESSILISMTSTDGQKEMVQQFAGNQTIELSAVVQSYLEAAKSILMQGSIAGNSGNHKVLLPMIFDPGGS